MSNEGLVRSITALLLVFFLMIPAMPISAAESSSIAEVLGSVSGAGNLQLRGVAVDHEGTLFAGDDLRAGVKSHAKVILKNGSKVELFSDTRCVVSRVNQGIELNLLSGNLGFATSKAPVSIHLGPYEVLPQPGTTGGVQLFGGDFAGIRVISGGSVHVRNVRSGKTMQIAAGDVQFVNVRTEEMNVPLAQVAAAVPLPIPSTGQQNPPQNPQAPATRAVNWAVWGPIIAAIGAGTAIIVYEATKGEASPSR